MEPSKEPHHDLATKDRNALQDLPRDETGKTFEINESGHVQELERNFSLLSLVGMALNVGSVWPAAAGSILVAIANGGVRIWFLAVRTLLIAGYFIAVFRAHL